MLIAAISARAGWEDALAVAKALASNAEESLRVAAPLLGPDAATMDAPALARAMIVRTGDRLASNVIAPVFWFALLGLPGLLVMVAVTAAARAMPEHLSRFEECGMAASRLRAALVLLPAWLAALLVALAAVLTPGASGARALAALGSGGTRFRARGDSITAAALTAAFNIAVPVLTLSKGGAAKPAARWSGDAGAVLCSSAAADLRRVAYLYGVTVLALLAIVAALTLARFAPL